MVGNKSANWLVLKESEIIKGRSLYFCRCDCGNETYVRPEVIKSANSTHCTKCRHKSVQPKNGDKYGSWTVIQEVESKEKRKHYIVKCDCGSVKVIRGIRLRFGDSSKCRKCGSTKHSMSNSRTYGTWETMIQRCTNPQNTNYKYYGGRGIGVCKEWLEYKNFLSDMGERPDGLELDRKNNNGHYERSNCHWVSHQKNLLNRRKKEISR